MYARENEYVRSSCTDVTQTKAASSTGSYVDDLNFSVAAPVYEYFGQKEDSEPWYAYTVQWAGERTPTSGAYVKVRSKFLGYFFVYRRSNWEIATGVARGVAPINMGWHVVVAWLGRVYARWHALPGRRATIGAPHRWMPVATKRNAASIDTLTFSVKFEENWSRTLSRICIVIDSYLWNYYKWIVTHNTYN